MEKPPLPEGREFPGEFGAESLRSPEHENEDLVLADPARRVFGVFDGMGRDRTGGVAATMAYEVVDQDLEGIDRMHPEEIRELLMRALRTASEEISQASRHPGHENMGTTAALAAFWGREGGISQAVLAHAGDSRIYRLRNGQLEQLTLDDGILAHYAGSEEEAWRLQRELSAAADPAEFLLRNPEIRDSLVRALGREPAGEADARDPVLLHRMINGLLGFLGKVDLVPHTRMADARKGDLFLICSDGITDNLTDPEIREILSAAVSAADASRDLVERAYGKSQSGEPRSKHDDLTAVVVRPE
jgi:PPM family protein phosphatase